MSTKEPASTPFTPRHIGPGETERTTMLDTVGFDSLDDLIDTVVPQSIRSHEPLSLHEVLPGAGSYDEAGVLARLAEIASENRITKSLRGCGYHGTDTPSVILRNMVENPAWYTAYTPYQPEISQGRLEMLLNFQTMVGDLCGVDISNASMLDEATAAAEAMTLAHRRSKSKGNVFWVDQDCHPQVIDVVVARAQPLGFEIVLFDAASADSIPVPHGTFGVLLAHIGSSGQIVDHRGTVARAHEAEAVVCVTTDPLALTLLEGPGHWGADVVVGSAQRFGVPMGYGGPHAGFMAVSKESQRALPGRLVGVSVDSTGQPAYRLALQTREQHIRREKATSNICTAQVLLANVAAAYGAWHGPDGLRRIAQRVHTLTTQLRSGLLDAGYDVPLDTWFDTLTVRAPGAASEIVESASQAGYGLRYVDPDRVAITLDETCSPETVRDVLRVFGSVSAHAGASPQTAGLSGLPEQLLRTSGYMDHPNFSSYRSETDMMRYLRRLADADLALDRTMIPLGSCTMKLNAATEMAPITWPEFSDLHPFVPGEDAAGYLRLIGELEAALCRITGYDAVSLQPNAGSQGELAGLLAIARYHDSRGEPGRDVCLIPESAHGTNAASAVMAGMRVVVVATDDNGNVDLVDLAAKAEEHSDALAAAMVTYPSTHGVFEAGIVELTEVIHAHGGQVYVDGANLNALVGIAKPGWFGGDVSHLNLHKTFCIPHGGGGPGVGPVVAKEHLAPFLPGHRFSPRAHERDVATIGNPDARPTISAAPFGSAGILPISWTYIALMGETLKEATEVAILSANYVARRLRDRYPILYSGSGDLVAHECILDLRRITSETGVTAEDVAKRLIDYGFHAPTLSFPVAGTLMVEPTESESLRELDRFCDAMIAIAGEIDQVRAGTWPRDDNPLCNAPHTAATVGADEWNHPYPRSVAGWPARDASGDPAKYWVPVGRIDGGYGDRNLMCSCPPVSEFAE